MHCIRVVIAARALEAGTKLSLSDVEVVQACTEPVERIHAGAVLEGIFETVEDVTGLNAEDSDSAMSPVLTVL